MTVCTFPQDVYLSYAGGRLFYKKELPDKCKTTRSEPVLTMQYQLVPAEFLSPTGYPRMVDGGPAKTLMGTRKDLVFVVTFAGHCRTYSLATDLLTLCTHSLAHLTYPPRPIREPSNPYVYTLTHLRTLPALVHV